jgi:hypothetical protein
MEQVNYCKQGLPIKIANSGIVAAVFFFKMKNRVLFQQVFTLLCFLLICTLYLLQCGVVANILSSLFFLVGNFTSCQQFHIRCVNEERLPGDESYVAVFSSGKSSVIHVFIMRPCCFIVQKVVTTNWSCLQRTECDDLE